MKKLIIGALALMSLSAYADEVSGIKVTTADGNTATFSIANTRSIKFADGNMIVNRKDDSQTVISLDNITSMTFTSVTMAINTIAGGESKSMTITDLNGRVVYQGLTDSKDIPSSLHGIYIITVNGTSHKVVIK